MSNLVWSKFLEGKMGPSTASEGDYKPKNGPLWKIPKICISVAAPLGYDQNKTNETIQRLRINTAVYPMFTVDRLFVILFVCLCSLWFWQAQKLGVKVITYSIQNKNRQS